MPRRARMRRTVAIVLLLSVVLAACATTARSSHGAASATARSATTTRPPSATSAPTTTHVPATHTPAAPSPPASAPAAGFSDSVAPVSAALVEGTWRPGCPVGPAQLRLLTMRYWGFDGQPHTGTMVVRSAVTTSVVHVFSTLYGERFPIRLMQPEDAYGGQDPVSMAADNTSGFNCRDAVAPGPPSWSVHAYGEAIDVNPAENPYLEAGRVQPPAGAPYLDRGNVRPGMAEPGGELVAAFAAVGWQWGGRWSASPDYQHFSATGG